MYLSASSALATFVERLNALAPLSQEDIGALKGLNGQIAQVRANSEIIMPGAQFENAVLVATGLVGRYFSLRTASVRSRQSTFPARLPTCTALLRRARGLPCRP